MTDQRAQCGWMDERGRWHGGCGRRWTVPAGSELDPRGEHRFCVRLHAESCVPCALRLVSEELERREQQGQRGP